MNDQLSVDEYFMEQALTLARQAADQDEVPIGAVVVRQGEIVGRGFNQPRSSLDPSAHAEIIALRDAAHVLQNYRLVECTLYVTVEPCMMCVGAIVHARIKRLVFGTTEPKAGGVVSHELLGSDWLNHHPEVTSGVSEVRSRVLMQNFFAAKRKQGGL